MFEGWYRRTGTGVAASTMVSSTRAMSGRGPVLIAAFAALRMAAKGTVGGGTRTVIFGSAAIGVRAGCNDMALWYSKK